MSVEELHYAVLVKQDNCELRQYPPHIVAETRVTGGFGWVGNVAFQRLAGYIFGKNRAHDSIAMTAPVLQAPVTQTIAMTAPVMQANAQDDGPNAWSVTFVMPAGYTMDALPEPLDARVALHHRPAQLMAAVTYAGSWSRRRFDKKRCALERFIRHRGLEACGPPVFARYNPPMTLWFQRRNEVLIPVQYAPETTGPPTENGC